jgi:hypothetical protein
MPGRSADASILPPRDGSMGAMCVFATLEKHAANE